MELEENSNFMYIVVILKFFPEKIVLVKWTEQHSTQQI